MKAPVIRATLPTVEVLRLLLEAPADEPLWATRMSEQSGLGKSTVSQILTRLAALAWIVTRNEQSAHPGRPPRVFCTLTRHGRRQAETTLALRAVRRPPRPTHPATEQTASVGLAHSGGSRPTPSARSASRAQKREPHPGFNGHWPIDFSRLDKHRTDEAVDAAVSAGTVAPVSESASLARLAELSEAHKALQSINQRLTTDFLARSAVAPVHRARHEDAMHHLLMEALYIRGKAARAHNY